MTLEHLKDYHVTVRVKNNWMLQAMRRAGYETVAQLSRASGVPHSRLGLLLNLKLPFITKKGEWTRTAITISKYLRCLPEELVPPQHLEQTLEKNTGSFEASMDEVQHLLDSREMADPLKLIEKREQTEAIQDVMLTRLNARERKIIVESFGLGGHDQKSLREIGLEMGIGGARAAQIRNTAIIKLKHHKSAAALKEFHTEI
jgi:hypothetical protein